MLTRSSNALAAALPVLLALAMLPPQALWAQEASSADGALIIYFEPEYRGVSQTLRSDTTTIEAIAANKLVTSVGIQGSDSWELCAEANYRGRCVVFSHSEPNLVSKGRSGRVSSARRIFGSGSVAGTGVSLSGIELFSEPGFLGRSTKFANTHRSVHERAPRVRSVRVRGATWELCDRAGFDGRCVLVAGDVPDLRSVGLTDHVGSLRIHVNLH